MTPQMMLLSAGILLAELKKLVKLKKIIGITNVVANFNYPNILEKTGDTHASGNFRHFVTHFSVNLL